MFFIIWGSRYILLTIGSGEFFCPKCQLPRQFKHKRFKRFFTLYYIPAFPIGNGDEYVECQSCQSKFVAKSMNVRQAATTYQSRNPLLIAYGIVGLLIVSCCLFASFQAETENRVRETIRVAAENTQTAIINNFGSENFDLCKNVVDVSQWELSSNAHLLAVNNTTLSIWDEYYQQLPASARATSRRDLTHVLCLEPSSKEYDTDDYGDKGGKVIYTCTRYRRYIDAYLMNVETRETIGHRKFKGELPPECPDKTNKDLTVYGDDPMPADIIASLNLE